MSTPFYDLASLVVVPSGYKASKVYAQKPLTTDGQLTFSRASTATRVNASGLIEEVASNVPRLDYLGSSCPRLLLEPQRTNLATLSEYFAGWSNKTNVTITTNYTTSPEGVNNASRAVFTAAGFLLNAGAPAQVSGTTYTLSCYAKRNDNGTQNFGFFKDGSGSVDSAMALTSEWQRFDYTYTATNTSQVGLAGVSGADVSVYGFQVEANASYATSYIPTLGAAVTRGADAYHTNSLSSLHDTSSGFCLMFDYGQRAENADIAFQDFFSIQVSAGTQDGFRAEAAGSLNSEWRLYATNITASFGFPMVLSNIKTRNKVLLKVETTGIKIFADGALAVSQIGSVTIPTFGTLQPKRGTSQPLGTEIKQSLGMIYFSPLLDDSDCIALTA